MMHSSFDLIEYQEQARHTSTPSKLFQLWDEVCCFYERGLIGMYELDEMKGTIWPAMRCLCRLQKEIDQPINFEVEERIDTFPRHVNRGNDFGGAQAA